MTTTFNLNLLAETQPSICIPRVFNNISENKIRQVFDEQSLGKISRIDIIVNECKNEKGKAFNRVYIHFEKWFWNEEAQNARIKLILGKEIKIIYDNPWFWKVSANRKPSNQKLLLQGNLDDERGLGLSLSDLNSGTDAFGRNLSLSDLNSSTDVFGRDLSLSDLNSSTDAFGRDLSLSDLNSSTDAFGRDLSLSDLSLSDLNSSTDAFGRDLILKRDYAERRKASINNLINNFRPINRRINDKRINDKRINDKLINNFRPINRRINDIRRHDRIINDRRRPPEPVTVPVPETEEEEYPEPERVFLRNVSEDVDNLNIPKIEIDYGVPIQIPKKKRITIKKSNLPVLVPIPIVKRPINWYDDDDTDEDINDADNFLTEVFNKMDMNDNTKFRPSSPDYPPPPNNEEDQFDIYADLDLDL